MKEAFLLLIVIAVMALGIGTYVVGHFADYVTDESARTSCAISGGIWKDNRCDTQLNQGAKS